MIRLIIGKLSSIFRNVPSCKKEEQVVRGLIREAQTRQERDLAEPDSEVKVLEIIRLVKSDSREVETIEAPPLNRRFLILIGGVLATLAIAWFLLPPTRVQDTTTQPGKPTTSNPEVIEPKATPEEIFAKTLNEETFRGIVETPIHLPFLEGVEKLEDGLERKKNELLAIALSWKEFATPNIGSIDLPKIPDSPYGSEMQNLRKDAKKAFDFLGKTLSPFKS